MAKYKLSQAEIDSLFAFWCKQNGKDVNSNSAYTEFIQELEG